MPRTPDCHPDRPHQGKGLCSPCYFKQYDAKRTRDKRKDPADYAANYRKPPFKQPSVPTCGHPDRKTIAWGRCGPCYQADRKNGTLDITKAQCHPDQPLLAKGLCIACYSKKRYWGDPEGARQEARTAQKGVRDRLRDQMLEAYGAKCACSKCPETNPDFLCLDHVNGDGKMHRLKVGSHTYADLRRQGWPQNGYRLLCWNCNSGTRFGRPCPHEKE